MSETEDLLRQAEDALHGFAMASLSVSPRLTEPYTDQPGLSPWTRTIGPQARRAHDLAQAIRKHLGIKHHAASRALGTPPLEAPDETGVARDIAEALYRVRCNYEREGSGPGSRFEGRTLEAVQAEMVIRLVREHDERVAP